MGECDRFTLEPKTFSRNSMDWQARIQEFWIVGVLKPQPHPQPHPFNK
jgi:hypothetical protein